MSSPSDPVDTTVRSFWIWDSPIFMIEPLPNCFSICASAAASALPLLSSMFSIQAILWLSGAVRYGNSDSPRGLWHERSFDGSGQTAYFDRFDASWPAG